METIITWGWTWLCILTAVMLLTSWIMHLQSREFYMLDVVMRKFSILDMQFPATPGELPALIKHIYALPEAARQRTLSALRGQLWVDFLFMPAAYGSIFLLCLEVAAKMPPLSVCASLFSCLGWLQLLAWICDIIENIYLLQKIRPDPVPSTQAAHRTYQWIEFIKWGVSLTGMVSALSALLFFWVSGQYVTASLIYLLVLAAEAGVFIFLVLLVKPGKRAT
ncbi:hypothetical protein [Chitinophaga sp. 212800010-3]|uniref:hypothetical protein n=1 Tax=unclassified Chitinophaga TaxID=2619133 RepID=UPI002DE346A6|nr:DUF4328 domain-containing protein [Chitinophaga sp. 212800010-3]